MARLPAAADRVPPSGVAGRVDGRGVWKTAANDDDAHLEIILAPYVADIALTRGTITKAVTKAGEDPGYVNLGKPIVENMKSDGAGNYTDGTIWDPESDKTYNSKMTLKGDTLDVEGCILFLCSGQDWTRVE